MRGRAIAGVVAGGNAMRREDKNGWCEVWLFLVLLMYAYQTRSYLRAWQSDLVLWRHATVYAPTKPRVWVNYGIYALRAGRPAEAKAAFDIAARAAEESHVPLYDRDDVALALVTNRRLLATFQPP